MRESIVFLVLAIISYIFRLLAFFLSKDRFLDAEETTGMITKIFVGVEGTISYCITFTTEDGKQILGESIDYYTTKYKYRADDIVPIKYSISKKGVSYIEVLDDDDLVSCRESAFNASRNITIVFLVISVLCYVKHIFLN